jgi:hypothetical protein
MRVIEMTVPPASTDRLLAELREIEPLALRLFSGASLDPPGDVVAVEVPNRDLGVVMRIADHFDLGEHEGVTMTTQEPLSAVSPAYQGIAREQGGTTWEELELSIGQDSTMTVDRVLVMFIAGLIAGIGIVSGAIHVVVGAMVIAPGFQPFARFVLGAINRSGAWHGGLTDIGRAYGALLAGATSAALLSLVLGDSALDAGPPAYLAPDSLIVYWTTLTWGGVTVGAVAAICGGLLISINRTVLTAGVMVALALVPTVALVPLGLVAGDPALAGQALIRFLVEVALVMAGCALVFLFKRREDRRSAVG